VIVRARAAHKAAFIDRDGVINEERDYVHRIEDFHLLPGVVDGLRLLQDAGFQIVVVTNQAGIARGLYGEAEFEALTKYMVALLADAGVAVAAVYHCPHHPAAGLDAYRRDCDCRKPRPGMLLAAAADLGLALDQSVLVGDKRSDIEAGRAAGVPRCVLVTSGHALSDAERAAADSVQPGLLDAARWLVRTAA
jgi:D-glycero-D-manno-heptose 1,7-bisphosphate phosphatase